MAAMPNRIPASAQNIKRNPDKLATVYLGLVYSEKTLDWVEKAYQEPDVHKVFLNVEPKWILFAACQDSRAFSDRLHKASLRFFIGSAVSAIGYPLWLTFDL